MSSHWALSACCAAVLSGALALAGCPTVDLGDSPPDIGLCNPKEGLDYFTSTIWPNYLTIPGAQNCTQSTACHDGRHGLTLMTALPIDYAYNYRLSQGYLNCGTPEASELLTKPLAGEDPHGGSDLFQSLSDPAVVDFLAWFN